MMVGGWRVVGGSDYKCYLGSSGDKNSDSGESCSNNVSMSNVENLLWRTNVKRAHSGSQLLFVVRVRIWVGGRTVYMLPTTTTNLRAQQISDYFQMRKTQAGQQQQHCEHQNSL